MATHDHTPAIQQVTGPGGLAILHIQTPLAQARVALQGAQLLHWQPTGQAPVLWVSSAARFAAGLPLRGGVPVCWPWFGPREGLPAHGFVRTRSWTLRRAAVDDGGVAHVTFGLVDDAQTRALWDHAFDLELQMHIGSTLELHLTTHNTGLTPMVLTQALHSYFAVADLMALSVHGLEGCAYLDKVRHGAPGVQSGALQLGHETDRIYTHTTADCVIDDALAQRCIRVAKRGSSSTVVWNPGPEREPLIDDLSAGDHQRMLCVETSNAGPDTITLSPQTSHSLQALISVDKSFENAHPPQH